MAVTTSMPMKAVSTPSAAAIRPLRSEPSLKVAMMVRPHSAIMRYSLGPSASITGRTIGMLTARKTAPNTPPISAAMAEAPSARLASPRWVIGKPSKISARLLAAPGTRNRMLVTELPQIVAICAPSSSAMVAAWS